MPNTDVLFAFLIATAIFSYMPGPSMLYAAAQTISRGRRAGWMASLGIHIGGYVHVFAAALGISVLFNTVPILYSLIKFAGAGYLIWLGIQFFRSSHHLSEDQIDTGKMETPKIAFWQSITVEVLNPKTAMFYIAFLPHFVDPSGGLPLWSQLLILGTFVNVMFSSADVFCVLLSSRVIDFLQEAKGSARWAQRVGGVLLIGLGMHLAVSQ